MSCAHLLLTLVPLLQQLPLMYRDSCSAKRWLMPVALCCVVLCCAVLCCAAMTLQGVSVGPGDASCHRAIATAQTQIFGLVNFCGDYDLTFSSIDISGMNHAILKKR
jgi:hypothetical protein